MLIVAANSHVMKQWKLILIVIAVFASIGVVVTVLIYPPPLPDKNHQLSLALGSAFPTNASDFERYGCSLRDGEMALFSIPLNSNRVWIFDMLRTNFSNMPDADAIAYSELISKWPLTSRPISNIKVSTNEIAQGFSRRSGRSSTFVLIAPRRDLVFVIYTMAY